MRHVKFSTTLAIVSILTACGGCNETPTKHFASLTAAKPEHMIDKGWIPSFISPNARDITLEEDLDAASVYGDYFSDDTSLLRKNCPDVEPWFRVAAFGPKWFSDDVKESETAEGLRRKGYDVLRCPDGFSVVILSSRQYVRYWSARKN